MEPAPLGDRALSLGAG